MSDETYYHDFDDSLEFSHSAADLPFWGEVYRRAFPGFTEISDHRRDEKLQKLGVDKSIVTASGRRIFVDEKVRRRSKITGRVYEDILIEFLSDCRSRSLGWAVKLLLADYIAYAIAPLGKCYLIPVIQLQQAWKANVLDWVIKYGIKKAYNRRNGNVWVTHSTPVPPKILYAEINKLFLIPFSPYELLGDS